MLGFVFTEQIVKMFAMGWFTHIGGETEFLVLMIVVILGDIVYGDLVILFKVDEIRIVHDVIKRKYLT